MKNTKSGNRKIKIEASFLVLCEGRDEEQFLFYFFTEGMGWNVIQEERFEKKSEETSEEEISRKIQILNFGGNEQLKKFLSVLYVTPGFENVHDILIVRDAERDAAQAIAQVKGALEELHFPFPRQPLQWESDDKMRTAFALFPSLNNSLENGTLEHLCIQLLDENDKDKVEDVNQFLIDMQIKHDYSLTHKHKSRLHTYFSVTNRYVGMKIGEAARAHCFNWNSPVLMPFCSFLEEARQSHFTNDSE